MPSNLLAHHLRVLEEAGLVTRRRSEGDRRRTYLHLVPGALGALAGPARQPTHRVPFVCTANSARSHLAAALWRQASEVPAASAGTHPVRLPRPSGIYQDPRSCVLMPASLPGRAAPRTARVTAYRRGNASPRKDPGEKATWRQDV
jgi:hypothetical protein